MNVTLDAYEPIVGRDVIDQLFQIAAPLKGMKIVHVNSTRVGGGVAEILNKMIPLMNALGLKAQWEIITGTSEFYQCTKNFHNALQGNHVVIPETQLREYEEVNARCAEELRGTLEGADIVIIHDPQPAALIKHFTNRKGKWIWRCHIDASKPYRPVWKYLRNNVEDYDASVFSLAAFAQPLPHPTYLIPPSIDPLTEKNIDLEPEEIATVYDEFGIDPARPMILQVSRYDRFKDPLGVIEAYRLAKKFTPTLQLVLAGGGASDDPEGAVVLEEVKLAGRDDPDIKVLDLPPDAHRTINALQRASDIVLQKSIKEGFGLTVTEALWKSKPVIGGNTGGIKLQVINHHTGFLVNTPEGAAHRIRYLLHNPDEMKEMGKKGKEFVRENFLLTRHLREYLTLMLILWFGNGDRIELDRLDWRTNERS
ncbi:MAG: glycosyltransferase [Chlorobi bacterium]|nr:glycosyltransferase [Chlorobiota bacterium]